MSKLSVKRGIHKQSHCPQNCDISHAIWLKFYPDDPILDGEVIHHKDENHDNNKKCNLQKMTIAEHNSLHSKGNKHMLGKKHTKKSKAKMSAIRKVIQFGDKNPFYGKTHTPKECRKISRRLKKNNPMSNPIHVETMKKAQKFSRDRKIANANVNQFFGGLKLMENVI